MRTVRHFVLGCAALTLLTLPADAAVWRWACMGHTAEHHIISNRDSLIVLPKSQKVSGLEKYLWRDSLEDDARDIGASFEPQDFNSGFIKNNEYLKQSEEREKLILTEKSSRIVSKRSGRAGPRDETTTKFKKVYRFALQGEKPRDIPMQCMEYILSTKGGRG